MSRYGAGQGADVGNLGTLRLAQLPAPARLQPWRNKHHDAGMVGDSQHKMLTRGTRAV